MVVCLDVAISLLLWKSRYLSLIVLHLCPNEFMRTFLCRNINHSEIFWVDEEGAITAIFDGKRIVLNVIASKM